MTKFPTAQARAAIAYCESWGLDPNELVWGYEHRGTYCQWLQQPRWLWYIGRP